ncbi:MAG TPA: PAS domain S-box protein, partial [Methanobacterium sp.]|nr:PAS domain S-box protein [Methanobacterium sp.]
NKHGKITDNEIEGVKKDGSLFWVSQNAQYYYDDNGEIQGTEAFVRDITERKKLEMERQQLAQQRQLALDAAKMGWWHYDPITEISTYDKQYKEIFGVSGSKRPNDEILKILHPDDLPGVWAKVEEALDPENPKHYFAEYRIFRDGEVRWIEAHGIATFEGEGNKKHAKSLIGTVTDVTERRNAEKSIQRSETQFKVLTNNLRSGVALIDETGKFKIVNPAFMELFNLDNELDILNVNNQDWDLWKVYAENGSLLHVDDHPIRKVAITGKPVRNQLVGVQNPGAKKLKWMLVSAEPMLNKDGSSMTICTYYDITQLKEAETELQTSHERFDRVLNKLTDLFAIADSKWRYLYVNDAYVQFVGKPREQLLGQVIWDIIPEAVGTINYENFMKTAEDGIKRTWVSHSPIGDRWMEYGAFSWDEGVAILTRDITERKLAEEEIQRNLKLLNSINKVFSESLTCKTVEEVVTKSLEVAEDLTGSEFGFIGEINSNGRLDDRAISPPGWDACTANPEKSLELLSNMEIVSYWGRTIKEGKSQIVNDPESDPDRRGLPEGHPPIRSFLGVPLKQGGKIIGMISLANKEGGYTDEDMENIEILSYAFVEALMRKRAEIELKISNEELEFSNKELEIYSNQLKSANDELESFAYSVSHDLRTPLRAIDGYSQVLLRRYGDKLDENGKRFLNNVRDNTEMMSNLINDILALSRAGRIEIEKSDVDMESLVNNIMEELKPTTVGRNIQFKIDHLPNAHSDRTVMRQILTNLLSNSIKFTEPKKTAIIEVGAEEKMDDITYYVKDNGVGFDMNYIHKLFDLFQRLHSQKEFEGTGVGLAIVKRLIDRQGGHIWAEGIVNEGATFYFKLPKHSFCSPKISDFRRLPKKSLKEDL